MRIKPLVMLLIAVTLLSAFWQEANDGLRKAAGWVSSLTPAETIVLIALAVALRSTCCGCGQARMTHGLTLSEGNGGRYGND